jgi:hypothetical protein
MPTLLMNGFCRVEVNPEGPFHCQLLTPVAAPESVTFCMMQSAYDDAVAETDVGGVFTIIEIGLDAVAAMLAHW